MAVLLVMGFLCFLDLAGRLQARWRLGLVGNLKEVGGEGFGEEASAEDLVDGDGIGGEIGAGSHLRIGQIDAKQPFQMLVEYQRTELPQGENNGAAAGIVRRLDHPGIDALLEVALGIGDEIVDQLGYGRGVVDQDPGQVADEWAHAAVA